VLGHTFIFPTCPYSCPCAHFLFSDLCGIAGGIFIGMWVFIQIINGLITLPFAGMGGVAWFAHIGGFFVGYRLVRVFYRRRSYW
jgi:Rhomboid family.